MHDYLLLYIYKIKQDPYYIFKLNENNKNEPEKKFFHKLCYQSALKGTLNAGVLDLISKVIRSDLRVKTNIETYKRSSMNNYFFNIAMIVFFILVLIKSLSIQIKIFYYLFSCALIILSFSIQKKLLSFSPENWFFNRSFTDEAKQWLENLFSVNENNILYIHNAYETTLNKIYHIETELESFKQKQSIYNFFLMLIISFLLMVWPLWSVFTELIK